MKVIGILGHDGKLMEPNHFPGPWSLLFESLTSSNFIVATETNNLKPEYLVTNNHTRKAMKIIRKLNIPKNKRILVQWEPKVVLAISHGKKIPKVYYRIYSPTQLWFKNVENKALFNWPQETMEEEVFSPSFHRRKNRIVIIQANKFSLEKGENYSLRRRIILSRENKDLDLYGHDWNKGILNDLDKIFRSIKLNPLLLFRFFRSGFPFGHYYKNYFGTIKNKDEILKKYKFSIVIENSSDYVSEKLFDSIRCGCLTFYYGPELKYFNLPENLVVRLHGNVSKINEILNNYLEKTETELEKIAQNQRKLLFNHVNEWDNFKVLKNLGSSIASDFSKNL